MKRFCSLLFILLTTAPALAADDFNKGCELYNAHKYAEAKPIFEATVKKFPGFWPAHYYLGHTYLSMGQNAAAGGEYKACQNCHPTSEVYAACQKALTGIGGPTPAGAGASPAPVDPESATAGSEAAARALSPQERDLAENKKWVRKVAEDEVTRLRTEKQEAIDNCNAGANRRFRRFSDGVRYLSDPVELERLNSDYDARIKKVKDDAEKKIEGMH